MRPFQGYDRMPLDDHEHGCPAVYHAFARCACKAPSNPGRVSGSIPAESTNLERATASRKGAESGLSGRCRPGRSVPDLNGRRGAGRPSASFFPALVAALMMLGALIFVISLGAAPVCSYSIGIRSAPGDLPCPAGLPTCANGGNPLLSVNAQKNFISEAQICDWAANLTATSLGIDSATTSVEGIVTLAGSGGTGSGAVQGSDPRLALAASSIQPGNAALTNSRTPTSHHLTHESGGSDSLSGILDVNISGTAQQANVALGPAGSAIAPGLMQFAADNVSDSSKPPSSSDPRMSNARTPLAHAHAAADTTSGLFDRARLGTGASTALKALWGDSSWHAITASDLPSSLTSDTSGNAATSSAFDHNPSPCGAGLFANDIAADGSLSCGAPSGGVAGPVASTDTALALWNGTAGTTIKDSNIKLSTAAGNKMSWTNNAGIFESGAALWLAASGVTNAWELGTNGTLCLWAVGDAACIRAVGNTAPGASNVPYSFNSDTDSGLGHPGTNQAGIYAGGVEYLFTSAKLQGPSFQMRPATSPPVACDGTSEGQEYYDSSDHVLCLCDGTAWGRVAGAALGACA